MANLQNFSPAALVMCKYDFSPAALIDFACGANRIYNCVQNAPQNFSPAALVESKSIEFIIVLANVLGWS